MSDTEKLQNQLENLSIDDKKKEKISKFLEEEFDIKGKSFLDLEFPFLKKTKLSFEEIDLYFRKFASKSTLENYENVLKTIPENPQDPNLSLEDFCYTFTEEGLLRHKISGKKFHWVNQVHYDLLGDMVAPYIQQKMIKEYNMKEELLPLESDLPKFQKNNIFLSEDALTNPEKLMLIIQGSGAVRAGQWARALCINDSLQTGSILPYIKQAKENGYGVIVFNPNLNKAPEDLDATRPQKEQFLIPGKPKRPSIKTIPIPNNSSPPEHTIYVWDKFAKKAAAKHIVIVAHSAGGWCTMSLLGDRGYLF